MLTGAIVAITRVVGDIISRFRLFIPQASLGPAAAWKCFVSANVYN